MGGFEELFDGGLSAWPQWDAAALKAVPAKRGVFLLVASDGQPILLTVAADIRRRLSRRLTDAEAQQRGRAADLRQITAGLLWRLTYSSFQTDWQFMELARAIWPEGYDKLLPRRMAWFVTADVDADCPHFTAVRTPAGRGEHLVVVGPFPNRRSAEEYIDALADVFDLCRCVSTLRQAPRGPACAYKQMNRCAAPCDGSCSMDDYRATVREAAGFAVGRRDRQRQRLKQEMDSAARALRFEQAAVLKSRWSRSMEFDAPKFARSRDVRDFRFVIVQSGPTFHQACSFVCDRGLVAAGPVLDYPPKEAQLVQVLDACDGLAAKHEHITAADCQRMAMVAEYMFSGNAKRGLVLRRIASTVESLVEAIRASASALKLREPKRAGGGVNGERNKTEK
ncbi:MAG: hypothetical protein HQ546_01970 [Planctomycetes bacterium]|nr:hypothetical protein [Planctomycetota bacterium]